MAKTTEDYYKELLAKGEQHQQQAADYLSKYDNRGQFSYDPESDTSYQALRDQYTRNGQRAMQDTMGQAAGLTGGYGSTYSQSVGQQAYNDYMEKLSAQIPGLAQQARAAWDAEGNRLLDRYNLSMSAANSAYGQARDALGDMRYDQEYADKMKQYQDDLDYRKWNMDRAEKGDAQSYAEMMIKMGLMPSSDVLAAAGWSADDVQKMVDYYNAQMAGYGGGSSGGGGGYGGVSGYYGYGGYDSGYDDDATGKYMSEYEYLKNHTSWDPAFEAASNRAKLESKKNAALPSAPTSKAIDMREQQDLFNYAKANGADALISYMYTQYRNSPNFNAVLQTLKRRLIADEEKNNKRTGNGNKNYTDTIN